LINVTINSTYENVSLTTTTTTTITTESSSLPMITLDQLSTEKLPSYSTSTNVNDIPSSDLSQTSGDPDD
jgi:hypothetical protein